MNWPAVCALLLLATSMPVLSQPAAESAMGVGLNATDFASAAELGKVTIVLAGKPETLVLKERNLYARGPFVWGFGEDGKPTPVEVITARNFLGIVDGQPDSQVILTVDAPNNLVLGTVQVDGMKHTLSSTQGFGGDHEVRVIRSRPATALNEGGGDSAPTEARMAIVHAVPDIYFGSYYGYYGGPTAVISAAFSQGTAPGGPWDVHAVDMQLQMWYPRDYSSTSTTCGEVLGSMYGVASDILSSFGHGSWAGDMFVQGFFRNGVDDCYGKATAYVNNPSSPCWCDESDRWNILPLGTPQARSIVNGLGGPGYNPLDPAEMGIVMHHELTHNAGQEEHLADRRCEHGWGTLCFTWDYNLMGAESAPPRDRGFWNTDFTVHRVGSEGTPQMLPCGTLCEGT